MPLAGRARSQSVVYDSHQSLAAGAGGFKKLFNPAAAPVRRRNSVSHVDKEEATEALRAACAYGNLDNVKQELLTAALAQARADGVDSQSVAKATEILHQRQAQEMLDEAIASRDMPKLERAMKQAKEHMSDALKSRMESADNLVKQLDIESLLEASVVVNTTGALQQAIGQAQAAGFQGPQLETAKHAYSQLMARRVLAKAEKDATMARNTSKSGRFVTASKDSLEVALQKAQNAGLDTKASQQLLVDLVEKEAQSRPQSQAGSKSWPTGQQPGSQDTAEQREAKEDLQTALQLGMTGALKRAIMSAKAVQVTGPLLDDAEHMLELNEARRELEKAFKEGAKSSTLDQARLQQLRVALERMTAAGADPSELQRGQQMVAKADAQEALTAAVKSKDAEAIKQAIVAAKQVGVPALRIEKASRTLTEFLQGSPAGVPTYTVKHRRKSIG
eukprot:gnl/TRDRNA2_/TRDRNA2_201931_c0_seq1.p1 gnl/TRDRNA2_/TRDRNA2_201931_c0~~gnl/TRDRNA2_/TRDRNA2_201931_c0_seq1.p1  ORF type:complete len:448 (-),score=121.26 gnl/TRDRNA2_/TRDRNA2_201931_c0_seq1:164-1507(-)